MHILIIEDNPLDAKLTVRELKKANLEFDYEVVETKEAFIDKLNGSVLPDVILSDYNLPSFKGTEAYEILKQKGLDIPFLLITGTLQDQVATEMLRLGLDDFILKDRLTRLPVALEAAVEKFSLREESRIKNESLIASERRLQRVLEQSPDAIILMNDHGIITFFNLQAQKYFGYAEKEVLGKKAEKLIPQRFHKIPPNIPMGSELDLFARRKDGSEFPVDIMLRPIDRENEKLMMAVVRDVTEQKKIEKERAEFTEQLELQVKERTLELEQSHKLLETYLKDIKDSINYALLLQQAVLSERKVLNQLVEDSVIYYRPKDVVSGDFYWFNELDNGNGVVIIAADCTGHGVPGAFLSMLGINLLNNIVTENGIKYPSFILEELDVRLQKTLGKSANEQVLDGMDLSVISVEKRKKRLMFAGGGRPLIHISDNELHYIKGSRFGVGAGWPDGKRDYQTVIIDYKQGDIVYLFSDGYADQFGGERGRKMMIGKLKALLMNIHHLSGKEQEKAIEKHFTDWKGKHEQVDDILLMGVRL